MIDSERERPAGPGVPHCSAPNGNGSESRTPFSLDGRYPSFACPTATPQRLASFAISMLGQVVVPLAVLLVTPHDPALLTAGSSCLADSYRGLFGGNSVFIVDDACFNSSLDLLSQGFFSPVDSTDQHLVWVEQEAVDDALNPPSADDVYELISGLSTTTPAAQNDEQMVMAKPPPANILLAESSSSMVLSVAPEVARTLDTRLPRSWKYTPIPWEPTPFVPVSTSATARVKAIAASVKFDPVVASIVGNISIPQMRKDVRYLTGEDSTSGILSRHAFSSGALQAAAWLQEQFESTGASCEQKPFLTGFSPNVVW